MPRIGLTSEKLVIAAATLADECGFTNLTLTALASRFDVRVASLYSHLNNSEDLKARVAAHALGLLADRAEEAVAGRAGKDALVAVAHAHRDFARERPGLFEAARHRLEGPFDAAHGGVRVARVMLAMLRGYALDDTACTHATRLLGSVFLGYPMLELSGSFDHRAPGADASWRASLDALDAMLRDWGRRDDTSLMQTP